MEELSRFPVVVIFRDFLHSQEMSYLKATAAADLARSVTGGVDIAKKSSIRTSKQV